MAFHQRLTFNTQDTKVEHETFLVEIASSILFIRDILFDWFIHVIWPHSGHYCPTKENLFEFLAFMGENDIINNVDVEVYIV